MAVTLSMHELAHDLAEIASETREPKIAVKLIALVNKILAASGELPHTDAPGWAGSEHQTQ